MFIVQDIEFSASGKVVLPRRSLRLERGRNLLLLGPSGCGKTTLMNLMAGLPRPTAGDIVFDGQAYAALSDAAMDRLRGENFGFVFQRLHLIGHLTAGQNIALALKQKDRTQNNQTPVETLLGEMGLAGKAQQKARDLSVGEAQRVAIARALANGPKVIFADEPTLALDDFNASAVMDVLLAQAVKTGASLVVATHDARIKDRFTDILEMTA